LPFAGAILISLVSSEEDLGAIYFCDHPDIKILV
jgi:hypothetical protein